MSRYAPGTSYNHTCEADRWFGGYIIGWTVDYYYANSRLRWPRRFRRDAEEAGARRFCKRCDIPFPGDPKQESQGEPS